MTFQCIVPPPPASTLRPIPTMNPAVKPVVIAVTKSASTLLITFTGITIFLFASLRIYDYARVIQLNMEIALICAHVTLLFPNFGDSPIPMVSDKENMYIVSPTLPLHYS